MTNIASLKEIRDKIDQLISVHGENALVVFYSEMMDYKEMEEKAMVVDIIEKLGSIQEMPIGDNSQRILESDWDDIKIICSIDEINEVL